MAEKYYISNNIHFIYGCGNLTDMPCSATRQKNSEARRYINSHPDHMMIQYGSNKKRNYVVSTRQEFITDNNTITTSMSAAKVFKSACDAYKYLDENSEIFSLIQEPYVINSEYKKILRETSKCEKKKVVSASARRSYIARYDKEYIRNNTTICEICGMPIIGDDYTIDHRIPLSQNGTNNIENLRAVHPSCNLMKNNMMDDELYKKATIIAGKNFYNNPHSPESIKAIRAIMRGIISVKNK